MKYNIIKISRSPIPEEKGRWLVNVMADDVDRVGSKPIFVNAATSVYWPAKLDIVRGMEELREMVVREIKRQIKERELDVESLEKLDLKKLGKKHGVSTKTLPGGLPKQGKK